MAEPPLLASVYERDERLVNNESAESLPMADLPRERLDANVFPFTHAGVEYFGPVEAKIARLEDGSH